MAVFMVLADTAMHVWVAELLQGTFRETEGASELVFSGGVAQRIRIYGFVVSRDELVVDDGTGSVVVRSFDRSFVAELGSPILVIGRPRVYAGEKYVLGELVKKVDPKWIELARRKRPFVQQVSPNERALVLVRKLDSGEGADYDKVVAELGANGEELVIHLLAVGELFETKPGRLKVLE